MALKPLQTWTIGVMCYNEVDSIEKTYIDIKAVLPLISVDHEIIIVDDGSTDGSRSVIERIASSDKKVRAIFHPENLGIGHTLRNIYLNASMENVANVPADGQFDVSEYIPVTNLGDNTFVSYFRKENTTYSLMRNSLSLVNRLFNSYCLGLTIKDVNWTKIYKSKDVKETHPVILSSLVETEICSKLIINGKKMIEIESKYMTRNFGKSKGASLRVVYQAGGEMLKLFAEVVKYKKRKSQSPFFDSSFSKRK